ncbi:MAG: Fur family transcriptional regulator [Thermodesulforhabdaceae bacterium]
MDSTSTEEKRFSELEEACKKWGLKMTPQRIAIYKAFISSEDHPSAVQILERIKDHFPTISLDTINRTLQTFVEMGLGKTVEGSGEPRRFDPNTSQHHHFRCLQCKKIIDFSFPPYDNLDLPPSLEGQIIVVHTKRVVLEGLCQDCKESKEQSLILEGDST